MSLRPPGSDRSDSGILRLLHCAGASFAMTYSAKRCISKAFPLPISLSHGERDFCSPSPYSPSPYSLFPIPHLPIPPSPHLPIPPSPYPPPLLNRARVSFAASSMALWGVSRPVRAALRYRCRMSEAWAYWGIGGRNTELSRTGSKRGR